MSLQSPMMCFDRVDAGEKSTDYVRLSRAVTARKNPIQVRTASLLRHSKATGRIESPQVYALLLSNSPCRKARGLFFRDLSNPN
jgi:hypothetical protein